jgi:hypothetical protein
MPTRLSPISSPSAEIHNFWSDILRKEEGRRKKEEGSSAADCVADLTDVTDRIPDYPSLITDYPSVLPSLVRWKSEEKVK